LFTCRSVSEDTGSSFQPTYRTEILNYPLHVVNKEITAGHTHTHTHTCNQHCHYWWSSLGLSAGSNGWAV